MVVISTQFNLITLSTAHKYFWLLSFLFVIGSSWFLDVHWKIRRFLTKIGSYSSSLFENEKKICENLIFWWNLSVILILSVIRCSISKLSFGWHQHNTLIQLNDLGLILDVIFLIRSHRIDSSLLVVLCCLRRRY